MVGTRAGGQKARATNLAKYGKDFYVNIGRIGGGSKGQADGAIKGFAANPELAKIAGAKGGRNSSRAGIANGEGKKRRG